MRKCLLALAAVLLALGWVSMTQASPIVYIQQPPNAGIGCLDDSADLKEVDFFVNMNDAPDLATRIAWSMMLSFGDGLTPAFGSNESQVCLTAHADSCCNSCNGFQFHGDDLGSSIWQFGYAGTACTGTCGSGTCTGTTSGKFMKVWVKLDMPYWVGKTPGTYYRTVSLYDTHSPADENLWTCCGGVSGISCDYCGGLCNRLGYTFSGNTSITFCVTVPSGGFSASAPGAVIASREDTPASTYEPFEAKVTARIEEARQQRSWGQLKTTYR